MGTAKEGIWEPIVFDDGIAADGFFTACGIDVEAR
jgi:hypothetical protein